VDPSAFQWTDNAWAGISFENQVLYELHVGTFTPRGTFDAAAEKLEYLRDLGITTIELMPLPECPGRFNWGYDGVCLYAPSHHYGDHDALKRFVNRAHELGLGVIADVVYNHLGPDGNYLKCFSSHYFSRRHQTDWGEALNFDGEQATGVRDFVIGNARYWVQEFHVDGFRLDATQSIFDSSERHVLAELVSAARAAAQPRKIIFVAENEQQRGEHLLPEERGGYGLDGMWNDDFHHAIRVALTGSRDGYFNDYSGRAQEFVSAAKHGFLFQGQYYGWQKKRRGSPLRDVPRSACVHFIQNHDQVANTHFGERLDVLTSPRRYRAATALLLLGPQTPLLFMGQEFRASAPFHFFADHKGDLRAIVLRGRREFIAQFRAYADADVQAAVPDPAAESTFDESKLDWSETQRHAEALALHRDLLTLRREMGQSLRDAELDGATLGEYAFLLRWCTKDEGDRLLVVNLGRELELRPTSEPLLAPPRAREWRLRWSSESPVYGGHGVVSPVSPEGVWCLPAECTVLLE
jgi:maltooligosyltrehalose trehalohydrolase